MRTKQQSPKGDKGREAEAEFAKVLENVCGRGFHGSASVTVNVQDGRIQYTRVVVDRMVK